MASEYDHELLAIVKEAFGLQSEDEARAKYDELVDGPWTDLEGLDYQSWRDDWSESDGE